MLFGTVVIVRFQNMSDSCSSDEEKEKSCSYDQNTKNTTPYTSEQIVTKSDVSILSDKRITQYEKFQSLKRKAEEIREHSHLRQQKTELRRSQKLIKKAMKDPSVKEEIESKRRIASDVQTKQEDSWSDIKPFLNVNDHLQGPVSHGDYKPKTELECMIEDSIKQGDLEEAEILSDTLANREFAIKISQAFSAKRCSEKLENEKEKQREKQSKKIRWTFGAKERWQMKGNM